MKKYCVEFYRTQYGFIEVDANSENEARERVDTGDYDEDAENIKGGDLEIMEVEDLGEVEED
jgi:hypothetical protein